MKTQNIVRIGCLFFLSFLLLAPSAFAHKFIMSTWVEDDSVFIEAGFSDGSSAKQAEIVVFDNASGEKLLDGKTNNTGEFSFKIPKNTELKIKGNAGMGHQGEEIIPQEDVADAFPDAGSPVAQENAEQAASDSTAESAPTSGDVSGVSKEEIGKIVEKAVDKKLRPLIRQLATMENREKPSIKDILGGVGYIIGLMGMGAYFNYRRKLK